MLLLEEPGRPRRRVHPVRSEPDRLDHLADRAGLSPARRRGWSPCSRGARCRGSSRCASSRACTFLTSASCASVVMPGLSDMKSLPWRITSIPSGARSSAMAALTTSATDGSSRMACALEARVTPRIAFRERCGEVVLLREKRHELAAAARHRVHLSVDVIVVEADCGEFDPGRSCRPIRRRGCGARARPRGGGGRRRE